jgi:hypothetical protein
MLQTAPGFTRQVIHEKEFSPTLSNRVKISRARQPAQRFNPCPIGDQVITPAAGPKLRKFFVVDKHGRRSGRIGPVLIEQQGPTIRIEEDRRKRIVGSVARTMEPLQQTTIAFAKYFATTCCGALTPLDFLHCCSDERTPYIKRVSSNALPGKTAGQNRSALP